MTDISIFQAIANQHDRNYRASMHQSALTAAELWEKHTDPFAIRAAEYWRAKADEWAEY